MGQHKYNQTAILAKEGKLPPKEEKQKRRASIEDYLLEVNGMSKGLREILSVTRYLKNKGY